MFITTLYVLCFGVAIALLAHAIYTLINHFIEAGLPHPIFIVFLASVGGVIVYGLVAMWAINNTEPRERATSFISLMVSSVIIWLMFQGSSLVGKAVKMGPNSSRLAFFLSTVVPLGLVFYVNVSRAIFALN